MTTSKCSEAFGKRYRMKDNTVNKNHNWKNGQSECEQIISYHKKLRNDEKYFIKIRKPYLL